MIGIIDGDACPFCRLNKGLIRLENEFATAIPEAFAVTDGCTLVIPKRHDAGILDVFEQEKMAVWRMVAEVRATLLAEPQPDGFKLGPHDRPAAGQT